MKKVFVLFGLLAFAVTVSAQDVPEKYSKIEDYELTPISSLYLAKTSAKIRKISSEDEVILLYQIRVDFGDAISNPLWASLTKDEIKEARQALNNLVEQSNKDINSKANYIFNSYEFESGFSLGYVVQNQRVAWILMQKTLTREASFEVKTINEIVKSFSEAAIIIEQLEKE